MDGKILKSYSRFLSLILRHKPETIGIDLDSNGWASVQELIDKINISKNRKNPELTIELLNKIVETNDKKRFTFNDDKTKIRASQGHSISVDLNLKSETPPDILYHGTTYWNLISIKESGLKSLSRNHVHLSTEYKTAIDVGKRHGKAVVLEVNSEQMHEDGYEFFISKNGVWLTKHVPAKYLKIL